MLFNKNWKHTKKTQKFHAFAEAVKSKDGPQHKTHHGTRKRRIKFGNFLWLKWCYRKRKWRVRIRGIPEHKDPLLVQQGVQYYIAMAELGRKSQSQNKIFKTRSLQPMNDQLFNLTTKNMEITTLTVLIEYKLPYMYLVMSFTRNLWISIMWNVTLLKRPPLKILFACK